MSGGDGEDASDAKDPEEAENQADYRARGGLRKRATDRFRGRLRHPDIVSYRRSRLMAKTSSITHSAPHVSVNELPRIELTLVTTSSTRPGFRRTVPWLPSGL